MAYYVHLSVTFNADPDEIPKLKDAIDRWRADEFLKYTINTDERATKSGFDAYLFGSDSHAAAKFVKEIVKKKNYNCGGKGCLFTWGIVGNYLKSMEFIDTLRGLFYIILKEEIMVCSDNRIVVFEEGEDSDHATATEIYLHPETQELTIHPHRCPFKWGQR